MRAPSASSLMSTFRIDSEQAALIRKLARNVDEPETLEAIIEAEVPPTAAYVRRMHNSPYDSHMWRVTVALDAMSNILDMSGVEGLGKQERGTGSPAYEYLNSGDMYNATLIYDREKDNLFIGSPGDLVEETEEAGEDEAWQDWAEREFRSQLEKALSAQTDDAGEWREVELDDIGDDKIYEVFRQASDNANEYWNQESDGSMYIDIKRIVGKLSEGHLNEIRKFFELK